MGRVGTHGSGLCSVCGEVRGLCPSSGVLRRHTVVGSGDHCRGSGRAPVSVGGGLGVGRLREASAVVGGMVWVVE